MASYDDTEERIEVTHHVEKQVSAPEVREKLEELIGHVLEINSHLKVLINEVKELKEVIKDHGSR